MRFKPKPRFQCVCCTRNKKRHLFPGTSTRIKGFPFCKACGKKSYPKEFQIVSELKATHNLRVKTKVLPHNYCDIEDKILKSLTRSLKELLSRQPAHWAGAVKCITYKHLIINEDSHQFIAECPLP